MGWDLGQPKWKRSAGCRVRGSSGCGHFGTVRMVSRVPVFGLFPTHRTHRHHMHRAETTVKIFKFKHARKIFIFFFQPAPRLLSGLFLPAMPFSWPLWLGVFVSLIVGATSLIAVERVMAVVESVPIVSSRRHIDVIVWQNNKTRIPFQPRHVDVANLVFQTLAIYLFQSSSLMFAYIYLFCILFSYGRDFFVNSLPFILTLQVNAGRRTHNLVLCAADCDDDWQRV